MKDWRVLPQIQFGEVSDSLYEDNPNDAISDTGLETAHERFRLSAGERQIADAHIDINCPG